MKIQFRGTSAVDIPGHDNVEPGDTVEVDTDTGTSLLGAGTSIADDGTKTAPAAPLWVVAKAAKTPTDTAEAGKDTP